LKGGKGAGGCCSRGGLKKIRYLLNSKRERRCAKKIGTVGKHSIARSSNVVGGPRERVNSRTAKLKNHICFHGTSRVSQQRMSKASDCWDTNLRGQRPWNKRGRQKQVGDRREGGNKTPLVQTIAVRFAGNH